MGADNKEPLSVGEFTRWAGGVDGTLKDIRDDQKDHGERLTGIETKMAERERLELVAALSLKDRERAELVAALKATKRRGVSRATWTTGISTGLGLLGSLCYRLGWYPAWLEKLVKP
jgi:hypothetical protein